MYVILTAHSLNMIRLKIFAFYLLNVTDALLTYILLKTDLFYEANILLQEIVMDTPVFLSLKILVPGVMVFLLSIRLRHATDRQLKIGNIPVSIVVIFYALVNVLHIFGIMYVTVMLPA